MEDVTINLEIEGLEQLKEVRRELQKIVEIQDQLDVEDDSWFTHEDLDFGDYFLKDSKGNVFTEESFDEMVDEIETEFEIDLGDSFER